MNTVTIPACDNNSKSKKKKKSSPHQLHQELIFKMVKYFKILN